MCTFVLAVFADVTEEVPMWSQREDTALSGGVQV